MLSVMNAVDGIYEAQLGLSVEVYYTGVWYYPDPYDNPFTGQPAAGSGEVLYAFEQFWQINVPTSSYGRHAAILFTGKSAGSGLASGIGMVCNPGDGYGFTSYAFINGNLIHGGFNYLVQAAAHELGHLLGADHVFFEGCGSLSIMNGGPNGSTSFCSISINQITSFLDAWGYPNRGSSPNQPICGLQEQY